MSNDFEWYTAEIRVHVISTTSVLFCQQCVYYIYVCYYSSSVCPFRTRRTSPAVGRMFASSYVHVWQTLLYGCSMWSAEDPTGGVSNEPHTCCMISAEVRLCHTRICPNSSISRQPYEYRHIYCRHSTWWPVHFWCHVRGCSSSYPYRCL